MQEPRTVITRDVYDITGRVLVNGTDIGAHVVSVRLGRDIPDGLPGSRGGFRSATCTVVADLTTTMATTVPSPWSGDTSWPPRPSDRVEVWLSDGRNEWCQIVGHVDDPQGSTDGTRVEFTVKDRYAALTKPVRVPALSNAMPPLTDATQWQYIGMQPVWIADHVARQCGRFATPSMMPGCFVSVPMMGSTWPQRGQLRTSIRRQADEVGQAYPSWAQTPYGLAAQNVDITVNPWTWSGSDLRFNRPLEVSQELPDNDASTYIRIQFSRGQLEIACSPSTAFARYITGDGQWREITSRFRSGRERLAVHFTRSGSSVGARIRLADRDGSRLTDIAEGTLRIDTGDLDGDITRIHAYSTGTLGAFQVGHPDTRWARLTSAPNAQFHMSNFANTLTGVPEQIGSTGAELLTRISDADLSSWWIDETDTLQWWDRIRFQQRSSAATLTAADHIARIPWRHTAGSQAERVHVDYKAPNKTQKWRTNLTLWQGGNSTLEQGDDEETIISSPTDEIWLGVDTDPVRYSNDTPNFWVINRGIRSVVGGIAISEDGEERTTNSIIPTMRRITDTAWAIRHRVTALGADEGAALQFPKEYLPDTRLWSRWRGEHLPLIRGMGKIVFEDARHTASQTGPPPVPDYTHNPGWLVQHSTAAQRLADYIAAHATVPRYVVEGVQITPVYNLQVGDTITLDDPIALGVQIRGIITSLDLDVSFDTGRFSQSIDLRVLDVTRDGEPVTWRDFGQAHNRRQHTWSDFGAARTGDTWSDVGDNPLKGT